MIKKEKNWGNMNLQYCLCSRITGTSRSTPTKEIALNELFRDPQLNCEVLFTNYQVRVVEAIVPKLEAMYMIG